MILRGLREKFRIGWIVKYIKLQFYVFKLLFRWYFKMEYFICGGGGWGGGKNINGYRRFLPPVLKILSKLKILHFNFRSEICTGTKPISRFIIFVM